MDKLVRFKMAENIDSQLKRMAEDLKGIIEKMNAANSSHGQEQSTVSCGCGHKWIKGAASFQ